jgi:outer membrane protein insertion porin family
MKNNRQFFPLLVTITFALLVALIPQSKAQNPTDQIGPIVNDIVVESVGAPSLSKDRVLANLATKVGQPYSERTAEQDVRALYQTGGVSNVRLFAEPLGNGVRVTVLLQGRPVLEEVIIEGAVQIPLNRVRRDLKVKPGDVVDEERIELDRQKVIELYNDRTYADVDVQYRVQDIPGQNRARLIFAITEGPKLVVKKITFIGNDSVLSRDLRKAMKTKPRDLLTYFNKSGRLESIQVEEDRVAIQSLYQNRGFADVNVSEIQTQPLSSEGVELVVMISEGTEYRVNQVSIQGVNIAPEGEVLSQLKMNAGQLFTPKGVGDDLKAIRDFYGSRGYVDMSAVPEVLPAGPGTVNLTYSLDEGVQSYLNLVNIQGNTRTQDRVIRRELAVKPGEVYDTTLVDISKKRLENLNYFERVETQPTDTIVPGRKDLNVIVEEKRTGSFNFGAGFSTIDSLIGFAELQQSNFDILNWPRLTGGGQRFRVRAQYGLLRQDFVVSLTEPWFMGYKLSAGIEAYYRTANFLSTVYAQENLGVALQTRQKIWRSLSTSTEYRTEKIRIYDVDSSDVGAEIQAAAGDYNKSAVTNSFVWDTRDSLFLTRKGELLEFTSFVSGGFLGGDVQDFGISFDAAKYFSLPWDMILLAKGQLAVTDGWGSDKSGDAGYGNGVPIFDRLYLGGSNNLRGFDYRDVGPVDNFDNPIGGNSSAYMTLELTFPIISRVRGAVFSDAGFVNADSFDFDYANYNANIGIGLRLDLPIGPIRVDYGVPVVYDNWNGPPGKFNFNIGYQF